jgi:hypothetical protein
MMNRVGSSDFDEYTFEDDEPALLLNKGRFNASAMELAALDPVPGILLGKRAEALGDQKKSSKPPLEQISILKQKVSHKSHYTRHPCSKRPPSSLNSGAFNTNDSEHNFEAKSHFSTPTTSLADDRTCSVSARGEDFREMKNEDSTATIHNITTNRVGVGLLAPCTHASSDTTSEWIREWAERTKPLSSREEEISSDASVSKTSLQRGSASEQNARRPSMREGSSMIVERNRMNGPSGLTPKHEPSTSPLHTQINCKRTSLILSKHDKATGFSQLDGVPVLKVKEQGYGRDRRRSHPFARSSGCSDRRHHRYETEQDALGSVRHFSASSPKQCGLIGHQHQSCRHEKNNTKGAYVEVNSVVVADQEDLLPLLHGSKPTASTQNNTDHSGWVYRQSNPFSPTDDGVRPSSNTTQAPSSSRSLENPSKTRYREQEESPQTIHHSSNCLFGFLVRNK